MRIFIGFGYNDRDSWIETQVCSILRDMGFTVVDGKDMHGLELQPEVRRRIEQSDAAIGFFTIREGQGDADFTSHVWVRDEMVYALAKDKPVIAVMETGVKVPHGLIGDRQYIPLDQGDRLKCVAELVSALGRRNIRRLRLDPTSDDLSRNLWRWQRDNGFTARYRTKDDAGQESEWRAGRLEPVDQGFYLNVADVPKKAYVEVQGVLAGTEVFTSGWASADAVHVKVY